MNRRQAKRARQEQRHGSYTIYYEPPPIPTRAFDWHSVHDDYDGAPDANDRRHGPAESPDACRYEIDILEEELADEEEARANPPAPDEG